MYSPSVRSTRRRRKQLLRSLLLVALLLTAVGGILYALPFSLQDLGRISRHVVGRFSHPPAPLPEKPEKEQVLRGTVYDRFYRELSVSYQLYSLFVHPSQINTTGDVLDKLAAIAGVDKAVFADKVNRTNRVVELADDLDAEQVREVDELGIDGVYCRSREQRFYPEHTGAAHVLGYAGNGIGLAGVESRYDTILKPGFFSASDLPEVDFQDSGSLGEKGADLILTLDAELQKAIDQRLQTLLTAEGVSRVMGVLLEPSTGRVLALSSRPSFDPNYFWKATPFERRNSLYDAILDPDLLRPLLLKAAARIRDGEVFTPLPPATVAAPDYGLSGKNYTDIITDLGLHQPVTMELPSDVQDPDEEVVVVQPGDISLMQMAVGVAGLINGGWRITPHFLDSVYDTASGRQFSLRPESVSRNLVLSPAMGVIVRRELLADTAGHRKQDALMLSESSTRVVKEGDLSRYVRQHLFVGMIPKKKPTMLLMLLVDGDVVGPLEKKQTPVNIAKLGGSLLESIHGSGREVVAAVHPREKNRDNFSRFLISRRMKFVPETGSSCTSLAVMPELTGMSLRKGLQRLNRQNVRVLIEGSGRIVGQYPAPGVRLQEHDICRITLESEI